MADPEHLRIVKEGASAIERWKEQNKGCTLDLSGADLRDIMLDNVDLSGANLTGANLESAHISDSNFFNANLAGATLDYAELLQNDLGDCRLTKTSMVMASLLGGKSTRIDMSSSDLRGVRFWRVDLTKADLSNSDIRIADLKIANLTETNLAHSKLQWATFYFNDMIKTNIENAELSETIFTDCDLSDCVGIGKAKHTGPSNIDIATLTKTFAGSGNRWTAEMQMFFLGAGVSKHLLDAIPRIVANTQYCTCFIGYGEPDKTFSEKLTRDLTAKGVSCWIYSLDSTPGESVWGEIGQRRKEAEKMIILCSAQALIREGVLKEIDEQIDEDPEKLIPISLDNLWSAKGFPIIRGDKDLKPFLISRNYADFSDRSKYDESLCRLLTGLRKN